jgi:serine/threonine protein kinase
VTPEAETGRMLGVVLGGAYRITRLIGEGGMGSVYEAMHLRLDKRVAVKVMTREMASNQEALARFHREAGVASHLGHPHLVNIIDFGTSEAGEPYLVMEYLDGEDLDHRLRRAGCLPVEAAVQIAKQVAAALAVVHAQGIVHRDLKPANIFLVQVPGEPDFVKVLDFGVSKIRAARTKLTRTATTVGTPEYMSPEQAMGLVDEIDHHTDQWALACITWEMLSGRAPFVADDTNALFYQLINLTPQPLSKRAPDLPPGLEEVLLRALSKRPTERYASMKEFARALEFAALGQPPDLTPTPVTLGTVAARLDSGGPVLMTPAPGSAASSSADQLGPAAVSTAEPWPAAVHTVVPPVAAATPGRRGLYGLIAVGICAVAAGWFFMRPQPAPSLPPVVAPPEAPLVKAPVVNQLPAPAPVLAPPPAPAGLANPAKPAPAPHSTKGKPGKAGGEGEAAEAPAKPAAAGKKAQREVDPFENEKARPKGPEAPLERKAPKPHHQRQIFQEL